MRTPPSVDLRNVLKLGELNHKRCDAFLHHHHVALPPGLGPFANPDPVVAYTVSGLLVTLVVYGILMMAAGISEYEPIGRVRAVAFWIIIALASAGLYQHLLYVSQYVHDCAHFVAR